MMRRALALPLLIAAACGDIKTVAGGDGGSGSDGASSAPDAGNPGDPLNGTWHWWIGTDPENPDSTCDVTIGAGAFEVYCPSDPYEIGTDCMQTKNDTRIQGTWMTGFDGTFDEIERYEGIGCAEFGHPDTDVDIVTQGVLIMTASQSETSDQPGFLPMAFGAWDWSVWEADDQANAFGCAVSFEPGDSAAIAAFRVDCVSQPDTPKADCTHTEATVITGTIDGAMMTSEGWSEDRYDGAGCAPDYPDPVVESSHTPMGASHQ
jgi:hypothetical protein